MKFTLSWLKDHLETDATIDEISVALTDLGLEVESIEDKAAGLAAFKVAYVIDAQPHPNADKLRVCQVDTGNGTIQVVCGAPNARTGMKAVFAPSGTTVPGTGLLLKPTTIRGVDSNGMLVSEREMGLSQDHDGIIDMPADAPVGVPFAELLGLNDPVFDIAITPNRSDCLGVRGIARDLAAKGLGALKPLADIALPLAGPCPIPVALEFEAGTEDACPIFAGRLVRGLKNGPSPDWLQRRLRAVGLRPISALVDITNFISLDRGRPLHVYDAAKLNGTVRARLGRAGESFQALDGKVYEAGPAMCVIADDAAVLGFGGVMGGEATGCTDTTTDVFIESALFDPIRTARTGRATGIVSDARYRFERGVDPEFVIGGLDLATKLVLDLCGGQPTEAVVAGQVPNWRRDLQLRPGRLNRLTGIGMTEAEAARILEQLGCAVTDANGTFLVVPPSWRPDIHGEADLIEEVVRVAGLEKVPSVSLPRPGSPEPAITPAQARVRSAKRAAARRGLVEVLTFSFMPGEEAEHFGGSKAKLSNPISADLNALRPSLLPNLIKAGQRNADRGFDDLALFEAGPQFHGPKAGDQTLCVAGLRRGKTGPRHWAERPRDADVFDAKADALAILAELGIAAEQAQVTADAPSWYHPGRSGVLRLGPKMVLATFGELHPRVLQALDAKGRHVAFEIVLDQLPPAKAKASRSRPALNLPPLMPLERDFAFLVDQDVPADKLVKAARGADKALIDDVAVFDLFAGAGVPEGKKSVALAVRLQPREKSLTDAEIEAFSAKLVGAVAKATGGLLRS